MRPEIDQQVIHLDNHLNDFFVAIIDRLNISLYQHSHSPLTALN